MSDTVQCPVCDETNTDPWDHDWGSREELITSCGSCGADYTLVRTVSVTYEAKAIKGALDADTAECENCGMLGEPLVKHDCCPGCVCARCGKSAFENMGSMSAENWCDDCEELMFMSDEDYDAGIADGTIAPPILGAIIGWARALSEATVVCGEAQR